MIPIHVQQTASGPIRDTSIVSVHPYCWGRYAEKFLPGPTLNSGIMTGGAGGFTAFPLPEMSCKSPSGNAPKKREPLKPRKRYSKQEKSTESNEFLPPKGNLSILHTDMTSKDNSTFAHANRFTDLRIHFFSYNIYFLYTYVNRTKEKKHLR